VSCEEGQTHHELSQATPDAPQLRRRRSTGRSPSRGSSLSFELSVLAEALGTVWPERDSPHGPLPPLLLLLTIATGLVDAASFLNLGHVFVANMTGNVVFLGFAIAGAKGLSIAASLAALGSFLVGGLAGGRIANRLPVHRGKLLRTGLAIQFIAVGLALGVAASGGDPIASARRYALIALLAFAMGVQNATVRRLAVPELTTTVLTMTLTESPPTPSLPVERARGSAVARWPSPRCSSGR
jgi:hypothetical protein